jgi:hypothetical protein
MTIERIRVVLGKPPFHLLLALLFGGAFVWPFFATMSPLHTWTFLYVTWGLAVLVLALFAAGRAASLSDDASTDDHPGAS